MALATEGLGQKRFHGSVVLLVNEHSASASEMVAAFAVEHRLATIVGMPTPGRLVGANSFWVGHGYRVALPVVAYRTWHGQKLEGVGVAPAIRQDLCFASLRAGEDIHLQAALQVLTSRSEAHGPTR